jgi:hypothetical protein
MTQKPEMVRIEKVESWKKKNWWDTRQEWYNSRKLNPRKEKWMQWNLLNQKTISSENEWMNENVSQKNWWKTGDMEIL